MNLKRNISVVVGVSLTSIVGLASPTHAGFVTPTEYAAESCEGNSIPFCYETYLAAYPYTETSSTPVVVIEEDEFGWDCSTMGNKICGPGAIGSLTTPETLIILPETC